VRIIAKIIAGILGVIYLVYGLIALYNWFSSTFPIGFEPLNVFLTLNVPGDIGYSIALITIGSILTLSLVSHSSEVQSLSALTVGTFLALALFILHILVILANIADVLILKSVGEEAEFNILSELQKIEFYGGLISLVLLYFVLKELSSKGLARMFRRK